MPIEIYGSDEAGHLMLLPDPTPAEAVVPPAGEPPLPGADAPDPEIAATPPAPEPAPADDLAALRRLIEEREQARTMQEVRRDAQLETMQRMLSGAAPPMPETPPPPTGPPQAADFAQHEDYVLAAARYGAQQELQQRDQHIAQARQQMQQLTFQKELVEREQAFKAAHPDFDAVVSAGLHGKVSPVLQQALMLAPEGPAVAYQLAQQPELVQRLNTLAPPLVLLELGRLMPGTPPDAEVETPLGSGTETSPPTGPRTPQAAGPMGRPKPPPPRPLSGTGVAPVGGFRDDMSMAEYRAWKKQANIQ